jgi:hypothetical protein
MITPIRSIATMTVRCALVLMATILVAFIVVA